ncbi:MAG: cupredoxin domain-containing protein [Acidimicrobiales bacterium]
MVQKLIPIGLLCALLVAACSSGGDTEVATATSVPATTVSHQPVEPAPAPTIPTPTLPDYADDIAALPSADDDRTFPDVAPDSPQGAYGFSRYVYQRAGDEIVPTLVEGPQGKQVRCQDLDRDCSYLELKALYESGDDVPEYLSMDRATLGELVEQLGRTEAAVNQYENIDDACAAGMFVSSAQSPNMGIHMYDLGAGFGFDPDRPQMVLFAREGGESAPMGELGACRDGTFTGDGEAFAPVGAVFNIEFTAEHPEGFAGELDNWHVHYNLCQGGSASSSSGQDQCEANGGDFTPVVSSWMMHAYVTPEFDSQGGVFSMFNPAIWPIVEPTDLEDLYTIPAEDGAVAAPITNFDFGDIELGVGETVRFSNTDSVPHTVTAGSALDPNPDAFDSGLLGTAQTFDLSFDSVGQYELFCVLHPDMTTTVTVN